MNEKSWKCLAVVFFIAVVVVGAVAVYGTGQRNRTIEQYRTANDRAGSAIKEIGLGIDRLEERNSAIANGLKDDARTLRETIERLGKIRTDVENMEVELRNLRNIVGGAVDGAAGWPLSD
jgi:hypothetical protein